MCLPWNVDVMRRAAEPALCGLALISLGCGEPDPLPPRGQIVFGVTTDAPVVGDPDAPPALFDRLRIEVFPRGATEPCVGCSREFEADANTLDQGAATIGITADAGSAGIRVRVQLYRSAGAFSFEPRPESTIETIVSLPALPAEGIVNRHVVLRTESVGAPVGALEKPAASIAGPPPADLVASWKPALTTMCNGEPQPDEVCVPGGAFWMGDPRLDLTGLPENDGERERLVVVSPFFMSKTEVTVAEYRKDGHIRRKSIGGPADNPHERDTGIVNCTFTSDPSDADDQPVNCISWDLSLEYCEDRGGSLPSEAQLEYVMGGRRSARFVWGDDLPTCADGTFDRSSTGDECGALGVGVSDVGRGERDRLRVPGGELVDLNGNVREWALDRWNRQTEVCWSTPLLTDPVCDAVSDADGDARSARGAYFSADRSLAVAAVRAFLANERFAVASEVGFRCVRPD